MNCKNIRMKNWSLNSKIDSKPPNNYNMTLLKNRQMTFLMNLLMGNKQNSKLEKNIKNQKNCKKS